MNPVSVEIVGEEDLAGNPQHVSRSEVERVEDLFKEQDKSAA